jgi:predicted RNase H-like HicB family nuclease
MKQVKVEVEYTGKNFSAFVPELLGCISAGKTPEELKKNITEAINSHIALCLADGDELSTNFKEPFQLIYHFDTLGLLAYYKGIFKNAALERITGINQKQLAHYANGTKQPRPSTAKKIEEALHTLGAELLTLRL